MYKEVGGYREASCCHDAHGVQQMALGKNTQFTYIYWSEGVGLPKSSSLVHSLLRRQLPIGFERWPLWWVDKDNTSGTTHNVIWGRSSVLVGVDVRCWQEKIGTCDKVGAERELRQGVRSSLTLFAVHSSQLKSGVGGGNGCRETSKENTYVCTICQDGRGWPAHFTYCTLLEMLIIELVCLVS